jgi:hypothetical protein
MTVTFSRLTTLCAIVGVGLPLTACKPATETRKRETPPAASSAPAAKPPTPITFSHDALLDSFGYYFTDTTIQSGALKLASLNIGQASDFADWEAGKRPVAYAPVFLEFEDVTSPTAANAQGQLYHTVSLRVMPTAYRVDGGAVTFRGTDPRLGEVRFSGTFDLNALKDAKGEAPSEPQPVLRGDLQVGDQQFHNLGFMYFGGD